MRLIRAALMLAIVAISAGCAGNTATTSNFELTPQKIGWYAGEEASFVLELSGTLTRGEPRFEIDRNFALEEIHFEEQGAKFGGDFTTRNPEELGLRLLQRGEEGESFILTLDNPRVEVRLKVPETLRDSSYTLEVKLFEVGWVKSQPFRVDLKP